MGNIKDGLDNAWSASKARRKKIPMGCKGCLFFGYAELSLLYSLKPEVMLNGIKVLRHLK